MLSESELIAQCRQGIPEAWEDLFQRHYDATGRFVFQLDSDITHEDVEEICQETFLAAIRNLDSFHGESQLQTWLFRIAANKARDWREKRMAAKRGGGRVPVSLQAVDPRTGQTIDPPADNRSPDDDLLRQEDTRLVHMALSRIEAPCRELLDLRYFGDLSYEEIGASLNLNEKTVSSRLSRCLDRLEEIAWVLFIRENKSRSPV